MFIKQLMLYMNKMHETIYELNVQININEKTYELTIAKHKETVDSIIKQLNEQRRLLRNTFYNINLDQLEEDETESSNSIQ
jgi:hypothetical protein